MNERHQVYTDLPYITRLEDAADNSLYTSIPYSWNVIATDIVNSTIAINAGKYREVNFASAAITAAITSVFEDIQIPFSFGGDGVVLVVPPVYEEQVLDVLTDTQKFIEQKLSLAMRVGVIPHVAIMREKAHIKVLKYKIAEDMFQPFFSGGGVQLAEQLLKKDDTYFVEQRIPKFHAQFSNVQCVMRRIRAQHEEVCSILVQSLIPSQTEALHREIAALLDQYHAHTIDYRLQPGRIMDWVTRHTLQAKALTYRTRKPLTPVIIQSMMREQMQTLKKTPKHIATASRQVLQYAFDAIKLEDGIKGVVSMSSSQRKQLEKKLMTLADAGQIAFGIHVSNQAYVTCAITQHEKQQQFFLDGDFAGYTQAAKQLKNQIGWFGLRKQYV